MGEPTYDPMCADVLRLPETNVVRRCVNSPDRGTREVDLMHTPDCSPAVPAAPKLAGS